MDQIPEYACRVRGNASSWRKVLLMAGFGNAGMVPPQVSDNIANLIEQEEAQQSSYDPTADLQLWRDYAANRPYVAPTPQAHVAQIISGNRQAILKDTVNRANTDANWNGGELPQTQEEVDETMRELVQALLDGDDGSTLTNNSRRAVGTLASFLNERMCVPRDMGAVPAAALEHLAWQLKTYN